MHNDEEFGLDRRIGFETDDEENQADMACSDDMNKDGSDSDGGLRSPGTLSVDCIDTVTWPQTFRKSMDMYSSMAPPSFAFLTGSAPSANKGFLTSAYRRSNLTTVTNSVDEPLISDQLDNKTSLDNEALLPTTNHYEKLSSTPQMSHFSSNIMSTPEPQCSFTQSLLNSVNCLCGIGLLSTPYALREGGWWCLVILFTLGVIACYTGILLKRCLDSSPDLKTYPDIGLAAFGVPGRVFLAIILYMELYSSCVEYLIMMADNLSALFPNAHLNLIIFSADSHLFCTIISTLFILPTVWLRNLSLLSYISVGGVVTAVMVSICLLWVGVVDGVGFHSRGTALDLAKLPVTIGLFGFCYGGHSVFPNIYSSMKQPSKFPYVLLISFAVSALLYAGVGICGFLMFGNSTKSQFTLNMPTTFIASKVAAWTTVIAPVTKYALTITPVALSLEELLPSSLRKSHCISLLIRTCLVFSTFVVAMTIPYFGSVMALIGSMLVMMLSLIVPCACYLSICRNNLSKLQISACAVTMIIGLSCAIVGTYGAIGSIADKL